MANAKHAGGRPRGRFNPDIDWELAKRLFVEGELVDGKVEWLSISAIAARANTSKQNLYQRLRKENWAELKDPVRAPPPIPAAPEKPSGSGKWDPNIDWELAKRLFVEGELVDDEPGKPRKVVWPSINAIALRAKTSKQNLYHRLKRDNWQELKDKFVRVVEDGLLVARAESRVRETREPLQILDDYIQLFDDAVKKKAVRADAIADFDKAVRLRAFLRGEAESRSEQKVVISLEAMQEKHRAMRELVTSFDEEVVGVVAQGEDEVPELEEGEAGVSANLDVADTLAETEASDVAASV